MTATDIKYKWIPMEAFHLQRAFGWNICRLRWPDGRTACDGNREKVWSRNGEDGAIAEIRVYDLEAMGGKEAGLAILARETRLARMRARRYYARH